MNQTEVDSLELLKSSQMRIRQWLIVAICIGTLALDGYDILAIAFAAPGITGEWGLSKSVLGVVLSLELAGMAVGSIFLGSLADSHGRRPMMISGLIVLTLGMFAAGLAPNVYVLGAARLFTGVGIGCILTTATATCSDYCNDKNRALAVTLVGGGFPLGIYLGATFLGPLLKQYDWRITFYLGTLLNFAFIPIVYFFVPETISFLSRKRPDNALPRIQKIMQSFGHNGPNALTTLNQPKSESQRQDYDTPIGLKSLFGAGLVFTTVILSFAYFGNIMTYYYFAKWLPTIVTDLGYTASQATEILGAISLGGIFGSIAIGLGARFLPIRFLMVMVLFLAAAGVALFPHFTENMASMKSMGFFTGVCILAAISGFFGLFATSFPSSVLASGAGVVTGIGRGGAVLGPLVPGFLFAAGLPINNIAIIMSAGSFFAGLAIIFLANK
jgi:benzoate transport